MKWYYLLAIVLGSLLLGSIFTYYLFPKTIEKEVVSYVEITPECPEKPSNDRSPYSKGFSTQIHFYDSRERLVESGVGSSYSNKPSECARLHDISKC